MNYRDMKEKTIAISISESPDMLALGLSDAHLRDAMAEIARHILAVGARLAYGGDLRAQGFAEILFELVARHRRDSEMGDEGVSVTDYLAWPVHITQPQDALETYCSQLSGSVRLALLTLDGKRCTIAERGKIQGSITSAEWSEGLTAMRRRMLGETYARIVLGGRVENYKGRMPGIAEEALLSLQEHQPLFLLGGFGGCAGDIAQRLGFEIPLTTVRSGWNGLSEFVNFNGKNLRNGLTPEENLTLIRTPHVDQAVALILRGLLRLKDEERSGLA
jgi:hypothetical protein